MTPQTSAPATVRLFNTLSRELEVVTPVTPNEVKLYCCGPTVYNFQHIGNLRTYIFEDLLVRTLRYAGYQVKHVMNITDVGHLVSDADQGEDKMALAAKREGKRSHEIAEYYTKIFFDHCQLLNISRPDVVCRATDHVGQMIALIKRLEERGFAYKANGNIYFDVSKLKDYGKLARLDLESLQAGARIEVDAAKKNPLDFALWFTKSKFENQELQWDSPWGSGYPGWHIECSAMAMEYLGESFDIHCGGIDHIPVHHTNEIAQSEAATGKQFARIWLHGGFLVTKSEKMSKSKGEFLTLDRLVERNIDPISYRLFCLSGTYRNELNWSWEAVEGAAKTLKKLQSQYLSWKESDHNNLGGATNLENLSAEALTFKEQFNEAIFNDLGFPRALAVLHGVVGSNLSATEKTQLFLIFDRVLGLGVQTWKAEPEEVPEEVLRLAAARENARKSKNWKEADELRDKVKALGFIIEDSAQGPKVKRASGY